MEDKTIKVRCRDNYFKAKQLTIGKEYWVIKEKSNGYYVLVNDLGQEGDYEIERFVKVPVLIVECINRYGFRNELTLNKKYEVLGEGKERYRIKNDLGKEFHYEKDIFKPVHLQKEIKTYSLIEMFEKEDETLFQDSRGVIVYPKTVGLNKYLIDKASGTEIRASEKLLKDKFTKVEEPKPVSTAEAFKALDEGKIIESVYTHNKYKREKGYNQLSLIVEGFGYEQCESISSDEILDKWIIREDK